MPRRLRTRHLALRPAAATAEHRVAMAPLEPRRLLAAIPQLVADVNANPAPSNIRDVTPVGDAAVYFTADDGVHGRELWTSDGTAAGTRMVRDFMPGERGAEPARLAALDGILYFSAYRADLDAAQLWRTDGTPARTYAVTNLTGASNFCAVPERGEIFFSDRPSRTSSASQLWKTDGTPEGTVLVKQIADGSGSTSPQHLINLAGTVFFWAGDATTGAELWKSDGTAAGTALVKDLVPGSSASEPFEVAAYRGDLYFTFFDSAIGRELWRSDGTPEGTYLLKDINPDGNQESVPQSFAVYDDLLYFSAHDPLHGRELWRTDGTAGGTQMVIELEAGPSSSWPLDPVALDGRLYFGAYGAGAGNELWSTDGTVQGTTLVKDVRPGVGNGFPTSLRVVGDGLYFLADDGVTGRELWSTDGTPVGTALVADVQPPGAPSFTPPGPFLPVNGRVMIVADDGVHGREPWVVNPRPGAGEAAAALLRDINPSTSDSRPVAITTLGDAVIFAADRSLNSWHLWSTRPGQAGATYLHPAPKSFLGSAPPDLLGEVNGRLVYAANDGKNGDILATDGTPGGQVRLAWGLYDPASGPAVVMNGVVYFGAKDINGDAELWRSDGTPTGTYRLKDIAAGGSSSSFPRRFARVGDTVFFSARTPANGYELWKTDGTPGGTTLVRDIFTGSTPSDPNYLVSAGGKLYFTAYDPALGNQPFVSDGTAQGTGAVTRIPGGAFPADLRAAGDVVYFRARAGDQAETLWRTDGTPGGTVPIRQLTQPGANVSIQMGAAADGIFYFAVQDAQHGLEVWRTDGSAQGTSLLADINPGSAGAIRGSPIFVSAGGRVYFTADDGVHGPELWAADGSPQGATLVHDLVPGLPGSEPKPLGAVDGSLYFSADGPGVGRELFFLSDQHPPTVQSVTFRHAAQPPAITIDFSESVVESLSRGDLVLINLGTGDAVPATGLHFDRRTNTATFTFATPLPAGDYRATLGANSVADAAGNALAADVTLEFFHLPGDVNRDRAVNFDDLAILAQSYNKTGTTFATGDLDGDGKTDFNDLAILAQAYNTALPAAPGSAGAPTPRAFSTRPLTRPSPAKRPARHLSK